MRMMTILAAGMMIMINGPSHAAPAVGTTHLSVQVDTNGALVNIGTNLISANGIARTQDVFSVAGDLTVVSNLAISGIASAAVAQASAGSAMSSALVAQASAAAGISSAAVAQASANAAMSTGAAAQASASSAIDSNSATSDRVTAIETNHATATQGAKADTALQAEIDPWWSANSGQLAYASNLSSVVFWTNATTERLQNGGFDSSDYWGLDSGSISISGGTLNWSDAGTSKSATQNVSAIVGHTYKVTLNVSANQYGRQVQVQNGGAQSETYVGSVGENVVYLTAYNSGPFIITFVSGGANMRSVSITSASLVDVTVPAVSTHVHTPPQIGAAWHTNQVPGIDGSTNTIIYLGLP